MERDDIIIMVYAVIIVILSAVLASLVPIGW